jgi:hypothetical protein
MARRSGAGASVSSGASYQARIGAFVIAATICEQPILFCRSQRLKSISFETTEEVDDINIETVNGDIIYIQAKANIAFSLSDDGDLASAFGQFLRQFMKNKERVYFRLVVGRQSSGRILNTARAALQAFQTGTEEQFRRDQNQAIVETLDSMITLVLSLQEKANQTPNRAIATQLLKQILVWPLDLEDDDVSVQAAVLVLNSNKYISSETLWGKIVSDCVSYSKNRQSLTFNDLNKNYERFKEGEAIKNEQLQKRIFDLTIESQFSVGREVLLCRIPKNERIPDGLAILELYRFDDQCNYRIQFTETEAILAGGLHVPVLRRASTFQGMNRLIEADPSLIEDDDELKLLRIGSDKDFESGLCADAHRAKLESAWVRNQRPLHCVRCGQAVSSNSTPIVELNNCSEITVGLCHSQCLRPTDRVIGEVRGAFFEQHPELKNFDVEAWFQAIQGGQIAFRSANHMGATSGYLIWNGRRNRLLDNKFVVEIVLENGDRQIVSERGRVTRYTKVEAEAAAAKMAQSQRTADQRRNPFFITSESRVFGNRSFLLEKYGATEKLLSIKSYSAIPYEARFSAVDDINVKWYAPTIILRDSNTSEPIEFFCFGVILTNPLNIRNYITNWNECGIDIGEYEIHILKTDLEFDQFVIGLEDRGSGVIVDPLFEPLDPVIIEEFDGMVMPKMVEGFQLGSIAKFASQNAAHNQT